MMTVLRYIGTALALVFIAIVLVRGAATLPALDIRSGQVWVGLGVGFLFYSLSQIVGAAAWRATLAVYGTQLRFGRAESQLLVSQIGKYIPGNVAHLFGRLALAREDGVGTAVIGSSMLLEVGLLLGAGGAMVGGLAVFSPDLISALIAILPSPAWGRLAILAPIVLCLLLVVGTVIIWRRAQKEGAPHPRFSRALVPIGLHAVNFALLGVSVWGVALAIAPGHDIGLLYCTAVFVVAWVAGFLMPGAPGGVGIRDSIIALGLGLVIGPSAGFGVALVHRMISVLGDLLTFAIGYLLRRSTKPAT